MEQHRYPVFLILLIFVSTFFLQAQQSCRPKPPTPSPTPPSSPTATTSPTITGSPTATNTPEATAQVLPDAGLESLAEIDYLGEGGHDYTIPAGYYFLVKRFSPFRFEQVNGSDYHAAANERVWRVRGSIPIKVYDQEVSFGDVWVGCEINYLQIDDDPDTRRNRWYIDGKFVHLMNQGMKVIGRFTVPFDGKLTLFAEDSIGAEIELTCPQRIVSTNTPSPVPPTVTPTSTPIISTHTPTPPPITSVTPPVAVATSVPTGTATAVPPNPTITPTASPTVPRGPAYTRFNFEMAGQAGRNGTCFMHRDTGELLLVWEMQDGWTDSSTHPLADAEGWIEVHIPHPSVYVEVYCDAGEGIVRMNIHNGVPHPEDGRIVGWLSRGIRNAIEIGWP
ncbi:MAG: hypothetical protein KC419_08035 [Anaerolineales bacterium]|nr:hypothetical protein [Anaerolineales bacterium]MCA9928410.1 hypothetical protein [Anaerolineales bacterium]